MISWGIPIIIIYREYKIFIIIRQLTLQNSDLSYLKKGFFLYHTHVLYITVLCITVYMYVTAILATVKLNYYIIRNDNRDPVLSSSRSRRCVSSCLG